MSDDVRVGQYVRRVFPNSLLRNTMQHRVESMIAGEPVTNCGRRLPRETKGNGNNYLEYDKVKNTIYCYLCSDSKKGSNG